MSAASAPKPDKAEAARFLSLLDAHATFFTFQTFDDVVLKNNKKRKDPKLLRALRGSLDECWDEIVRLNERGAGVFVTVNETDGKGRKGENIVRVRALFVDLDGAPQNLCCSTIPSRRSWSRARQDASTATGPSWASGSKISEACKRRSRAASAATPPCATFRASCVCRASSTARARRS